MRSLVLLLALIVAPAGAESLTPVDESAYRRLLAANKGRVVLVDFWATWCVPCRAEMPLLAKLEARLRAQRFKLITISADEPEQEADALRFLKQHGVAPPVYLKRAHNDEKFINAIDPAWSGALPALFLYDRAGKKVRSWIGETATAELEAAIRKLL